MPNPVHILRSGWLPRPDSGRQGARPDDPSGRNHLAGPAGGDDCVCILSRSRDASIRGGSKRGSFTAGRSRSKAAFQAMRPSFLQDRRSSGTGPLSRWKGESAPRSQDRPGRKRGAAMNPANASFRYPTVALILAAMAVSVGTLLLPLHAAHGRPHHHDSHRPGDRPLSGRDLRAGRKTGDETLEKHIFKFPEIRKEKTYSTSRPGLVVINVELEDYVKNADSYGPRYATR